MIRNRQATRDRLLASAEQQLIKKGFQAMGVNAIAARAGIDKVLIYRYFGGFEGLLEAMATEREIWPTLTLPQDSSESAAPADSPEDVDAEFRERLAATPGPVLWQLVSAHVEELRRSSLAREVLVWSAADLNVLTKSQIKTRRRQLREIQDAITTAAPSGLSIQGVSPAALYTFAWQAQVFALVENHRKENYKPKDWRVFDELRTGLFGATAQAKSSSKSKSKKPRQKDKKKRK